MLKKLKQKFDVVPVYTIKDYFALPKKERSYLGIYRKPSGLPFDMSSMLNKTNTDEGWTAFSRAIRKEYPVQGFLREVVYDEFIYDYLKGPVRSIRDHYHTIRRWFKPCAPRFRRVWPRSKYLDISSAIEQVNFALILDFWYEEVLKNYIDWSGSESHKMFYEWIKDSVHYIEVTRPELQRKKQEAYKIDDGYTTVTKIENMIIDQDSKILAQCMEYRSFFWT